MPCQCRNATLRAYREMRQLGQREDRAYDAAVKVFRHYHPEKERVEAYQVVADWLDTDESGPQAPSPEDARA